MSSDAWKAIRYQDCIPAALIGRVTERHHVNGAWIEFLLSATRGISPGRSTAGTFSAPAILTMDDEDDACSRILGRRSPFMTFPDHDMHVLVARESQCTTAGHAGSSLR